MKPTNSEFMKTKLHSILAALAALVPPLTARAEFAVFDSNTDSIALAAGTTIGTTMTIEAVFAPTSTTNGSLFFEQLDGQEGKSLAASGIGLSGFGFASGSITTSFSANATVAPRVFHHVAYVRDGAEERIYLDGVRVAVRAVTNADISDAANNSAALPAIGAGRYFPQVLVEPSFIGVLDSIRVSSVARYTGATITSQTGDMATDANTLLLMNFDLADVTGDVVADLSGNGRNGTLGATFSGATKPAIVAISPLNQRPTAGDVSPVPFSMFTDGVNDFATVPHGPMFDALETGDEVTFEGWMRVNAYPTSPFFALFDKYEATGDHGYLLDATTGAAGLRFAARQTSSLQSDSATGQVALQEWTHVAVTLNQVTREAVLYKNGEEIRRAILPTGLADTDGEPLNFGFSPSGGDEFLNGNFSEVRFWNRVLPGSEIKQRMFTQATGKENGLVSAWSMDEGSGTTLGNRVAGGPTGGFAASTAAPTWSANVPPVSRQRQHVATTMANAVTVALRGVDLDGDALLGKITSLPTNGTLFQFDGTPITATNTAVTDTLNRVTYIPGSGFTGVDTLTFSMSDATLESADALLTVNVTAAPVTTRTTWSAGDDWTALENPNDDADTSNPNVLVPEWSYGTRVGVTGTAFEPLTEAQHADAIGGTPFWQGYTFGTFGSMGPNVGSVPLVFHFGSGNLQPFHPREVWMHPGAHGPGADLSVVRWIAPTAGTYAVDSTWRDLDPFGGDGVSANVVVNGVSVFGQNFQNTSVTAFQALTLNAGDIVDFVLGNVSSGNNDSTGVTMKITRVHNVYDAGKVISRFTGNPNGVWRYGAKNSASGVLTPYTLSDLFNTLPNWHFSTANFGVPLAAANGDTAFGMHPSTNTSPGFATTRFTAPTAGRYRIAGSAALPASGNGVTVHLVRGGSEVFSTTVAASSSTRFDRTVDLSAGQTLDLVIGANGNQNFDSATVQFVVMELPAPQPTTVAHYRFEDGPANSAVGAMLDSGPYKLHGTAAGTLTHSTDLATNPEAGAFSLDARGDANFGQVNDTALLHQQGDWTVEMFFKANASYVEFGSPAFSTLAAKLSTTAPGSFLGGFEINSAHNGQVGATVGFGGGAGVGVASTGLTTRDNQWHHVAVVMDRDISGTMDELRLYVDGVLASSTQGVWPELFYGDQPLYIGAGNFSGVASAFRRNFDGFIDEFRLSSAALTPAQFLTNLAPTTITLNDDKVRENVAASEVVGTFGGTDPNPGDTLTFSLVPGAGDSGNASFVIVGNELRTAVVLDYTTQPIHSVRVRATDGGGKSFEQAFTITVLDAPVLVLPVSPLIVEATGATGAVVSFTVSATDTEDDPEPIATAVPPSGSTFAIGDTTVNVSTTDLDGTTTTGSFVVRVQDSTAPTIGGSFSPLSIFAGKPLPNYTGQVVTSDALGVTSVTQSPAPGTATVAGTVQVTLTAKDAANNEASVSFQLTVIPADPVSTLLASKNGPVPNAGVPGSGVQAGAVWTVFGTPSVNGAGQVAFLGSWKAPAVTAPVALPAQSGSGIFVDGALVVKKGAAAPGIANAVFASFRDPLLGPDGSVAWVATLANAPLTTGAVTSTDNSAIFLDADGAGPGVAVLVARKGSVATGAAIWSTFTSVALGTDAVAFTGSLVNRTAGVSPGPGGVTTTSDSGLWIFNRLTATTTLALREGDPLLGSSIKTFAALVSRPGSAGQGRGVQSDGTQDYVQVRVTLADSRQALGTIGDDAIGSFQYVTGTDAPDYGAGAKWLSFGLPTQNAVSTAVSFLGTVKAGTGSATSANNAAIFSEDDVTLTAARIVAKGDSASGVSGGVFGLFKDPVSAGDRSVAFMATMKTVPGSVGSADNDGIWWNEPANGLTLIAREGAQPPEAPTGARWKAFTSVALPESRGPLFVASMVSKIGTVSPGPGGVTTASDVGLWAMDFTGALRLLIREGDPIGSSAVKTFTVLSAVAGSSAQTRSFNQGGGIIVRVTDMTGAQHIVQIDVP